MAIDDYITWKKNMSVYRMFTGLMLLIGCFSLALYFVLSKPTQDTLPKSTASHGYFVSSLEEPNSAKNVIIPYSKARWRLSREKLKSVVLRISHILISYKDADTGYFAFWGLWKPINPTSRSREDALNLASQISVKLANSPNSFESIARTYSDDLSTKEYGGSLGNINAYQLPDLVLDALAVMKPGEVSRVIESPGGFHIVKRRKVQPSIELSAQRIVISYQTELPVNILPERYVMRTRSEAEKIAREIAEKAKKELGAFDQLVEEYSDHEDKRRQGDIGILESDRPGSSGRAIEILSSLQPGEISDPVDSPDGFQILRRTVNRERPVYGAKYITLYFDRPEIRVFVDRDKKEAKKIANRIARLLKAKPKTFVKYWTQYKGREVGRWSKGSDEVFLDLGIKGLAVGQISPKPIETAEGFHILKRIEPKEEIDIEPVIYQLPDSYKPDYDYLATHVSGENQARVVREIRDRTEPLFDLSREKLSLYRDAIDRFANFIEKEETWDKDIRVSARNQFVEEIKSILGQKDYLLFDSAVDSIVSEMLMSDGES